MIDNKIIALAPMLKLTDRHFRYFIRQITKEPLLYTEMIAANAIASRKGLHLLEYNQIEKPLALQLGGNDILMMAESAKIAEDYGFDEVNINAGCPSDRVAGAGLFGAALIKEPYHLAKIFEAMQKRTKLKVSIKTRIGIKPNDDYDDLAKFITMLSNAGCRNFIIHARSAVLSKLSPKQNRKIVPLRAEVVYQLKQEFPNLEIVFNGGIKTKEDVLKHLEHTDGVMIGEAVYKNPLLLCDIYNISYNYEAIIANMIPYIESCEAKGIKAKHILRHLFGLFYATPNASNWKKGLMAISKLDKFNQNRLIELIKL